MALELRLKTLTSIRSSLFENHPLSTRRETRPKLVDSTEVSRVCDKRILVEAEGFVWCKILADVDDLSENDRPLSIAPSHNDYFGNKKPYLIIGL